MIEITDADVKVSPERSVPYEDDACECSDCQDSEKEYDRYLKKLSSNPNDYVRDRAL